MSWTEVDSAATSPAEAGIALSVLKTRVILGVGNLPSQNPHYGYINDATYINEAKDTIQSLVFDDPRLRKTALSLMPRLVNWRWYDVTVNGQIYLTLPANLLWLDHVTYTKSTSAFAPATQTEYPMVEEIDPAIFGQKSKTAVGWPTVFCRAGSRIEIWPTPSTAYLTNVVLHGVRAEDDLSQATDKLKMPQRLQKYVIKMAVAITRENAGMDGGAGARAAVEDQLRKELGIAGQERMRDKIVNRIAGTPR